jgi:hypothetical protein
MRIVLPFTALPGRVLFAVALATHPPAGLSFEVDWFWDGSRSKKGTEN